MTLEKSLQTESLEDLQKRKLHLDQALMAATEHGVTSPPELQAEFELVQQELTRREKQTP